MAMLENLPEPIRLQELGQTMCYFHPSSSMGKWLAAHLQQLIMAKSVNEELCSVQCGLNTVKDVANTIDRQKCQHQHAKTVKNISVTCFLHWQLKTCIAMMRLQRPIRTQMLAVSISFRSNGKNAAGCFAEHASCKSKKFLRPATIPLQQPMPCISTGSHAPDGIDKTLSEYGKRIRPLRAPEIAPARCWLSCKNLRSRMAHKLRVEMMVHRQKTTDSSQCTCPELAVNALHHYFGCVPYPPVNSCAIASRPPWNDVHARQAVSYSAPYFMCMC